VTAVLGVLIIVEPGCGGSKTSGTTATPVVAATPAPVPSPVATEPSHTPTPPPCTQGLCEEPVTNTNAPVRLTIRVYKVEDPNGIVVNGFTTEFPVGYRVTVDATAKDRDNRDTLGSGTVAFSFSDPLLVKVGSNHGYQKKLTILAGGDLQVQASLDGIDSNVLELTFRE